MRGLQTMSLFGAWTTLAVVVQLAGGGHAAAPAAVKRASPPVQVGLAPQERPQAKQVAARAEAAPAPAKGTGRASDGAAIRIDASFDDPARTVSWMLREGNWMAVLVDRDHRPVGRVLADGRVVAPGVVTSGVPRLATAEVMSILPQGLPQGATAAWLIWPSRHWLQVERGLRAHGDIRSAKVRYSLTSQGLAVTVVEVQTAHGAVKPNDTFIVQSQTRGG